MNQKNVVEAVYRLYNTRGDDHTVRDYLSDLDNAFEEEAYRNATDETILEDVERYRIAAAQFDDVSNPDYTEYGHMLRMKQAKPDLSEYWNRMARFQRDRIVKEMLEELDENRSFDWMQLNGKVAQLVASTARDLLRRSAPVHDDDIEYYALCTMLFDHCKRRALGGGRDSLNYK